MSTEIIDIDALLGEPKKVKLGGKIYTLPAQMPVGYYLRMRNRQKERAENKENTDTIETLYEETLELFKTNHPDVKELPLGITQLLEVIARVYNPDVFEQDNEADPLEISTTIPDQDGSENTTNQEILISDSQD